MEQWNGFKGTKWKEGVDTRDFIQNNYTEYRGDDSFLEGPTEATEKLWDELQKLNDIQFERNGVYDMDTEIVSTITSHDAGYLDKDLEKIVGLQTDKPLKHIIKVYLTLILLKCVLLVKTKSLQGFQTLTVADVSSVTIVVWHCMESTI